LPVGFSDHTESSLAAAVAVSKGVQWIEKHFTLNRAAEGFDHAYAMEPDGLAAYIEDIRQVEQACRIRPEKVAGKEAEVKKNARRGLYAARDIDPGESISEGDILVVRPEAPLRPNDLAKVVEHKAALPIRKYQSLNWNQLH
jgi:sialic acid synthase SpsE